jgi:hypothetical protein
MGCCGQKKSANILVNLTPSTFYKFIKGGVMQLLRIQEQLASERLSICRTRNEGKPCDKYGNGPTCKQCGCFLTKKVRLLEESCPLQYWPKAV